MALLNLFGEPMISPDLKSALDMVSDKDVLEAILHVRRELWGMSTREYIDKFDAAITCLKLDYGTPDHEMAEILADGLDRMADHMAALGGPTWTRRVGDAQSRGNPYET
jgi:hypothetical protein